MTKARWRQESRLGGENSTFWRGNVQWLAFNEGGRYICGNIKLRDGWLPVGFYFAIGVGGRFLRLHRGWAQ